MNYHPLTKKISKLLTENNLWFETFKHEEVRTSNDAAKVRTGYSLKQGAKALIVRIKSNGERKFVMLVIPGDARFDKKKTQDALNSKDIRFATEEEVLTVTEGVKIGGIPPFGNLFGIAVIVDPSIFENEKIIFNAGDRSFSIAMYSGDYKRLINPVVKEII